MTIRRLVPLLLLPVTACKENVGLNLFTVQDDIDFGQEVRDEILADPDTYPVVTEDDHPDAYDHLFRVRDAVLTSDELRYEDDFEWEVYLIHDDETLNAFAAPGGYIWVYTGLLHYLESEDHFAGVMAHEIAHADRRHTTQQLTRQYGIATLLEVALGEDPGLVAEIAAGLVTLEFSRTHEEDADAYSVRYLCDTDYAADGAAGFFEKLDAEGGIEVPEFLSTHPSSESRVEEITALAAELGCDTEPNPSAEWADFQASLPDGTSDE